MMRPRYVERITASAITVDIPPVVMREISHKIINSISNRSDK
jgi:hypothetical protein